MTPAQEKLRTAQAAARLARDKALPEQLKTKKFNGGIQVGTTASSNESDEVDKIVQAVSHRLRKRYCANLHWQPKLEQKHIPGGIGSCQPDGGLFFRNNKLVLVIEAKHQGDRGNAIERWFKNFYICNKINPDVNYVTFARGLGASMPRHSTAAIGDMPIFKTLHILHQKGFNQYNPNECSTWLNVNGFTEDFVESTIEHIIQDMLIRLPHTNAETY